MTTARCGTDSGYQAHRRRGEDTCPACKAAHAASLRARNRARRRALTRLAALHPADYQRLYIAECRRDEDQRRAGVTS